MNEKNNKITGLALIVIGLLLVILKNEVISLVMTVMGVALIVSAVSDFRDGASKTGTVKAVIGVCIIVFGWVFVNLALYIIAAIIIIQSIFSILDISKALPSELSLGQRVTVYLKPAAGLVAGGCLLFNLGGTMAWVFILSGILLIVEGILSLVEGKR